MQRSSELEKARVAELLLLGQRSSDGLQSPELAAQILALPFSPVPNQQELERAMPNQIYKMSSDPSKSMPFSQVHGMIADQKRGE